MDAAESVVLYTWTFERYPLRFPPWPDPLANERVAITDINVTNTGGNVYDLQVPVDYVFCGGAMEVC